MEKKLSIQDIKDLGFVFSGESDHKKMGQANGENMECIQGYTKDLGDYYCHMHLFNFLLEESGYIEHIFITDFGSNEKPFSGYYEGGIGGSATHISFKNKSELIKLLEQIGIKIKSNT